MSDPQCVGRDHLFVSYRHDDARGASGRLYDWLRIAFGREYVFRDVHSIGVGKWRDKIDDALARSTVCVAVIGPRWANPENVRRLHDEGDMVRHELVTALASPGLSVVPTLVEGAEVPKAVDLPLLLRPLVDVWNARSVTEDGWEDDTRRLIAEIAEAARLVAQPDLETLLRDVGAAQHRLTELEQTRRLQADQIDGLRRTVDELRRKLAEAPARERAGLAAAFAALARGDSLAAEDAFEREFDAQSRVAEDAHTVMAEAARNVANLALLRDVAKAVAFYRKALAVEPAHAETARRLGHAWMWLGNTAEAKAAFTQSLTAAITTKDAWGEMAACVGLGDVSQVRGQLAPARMAYATARGLVERLAAGDPSNTQWQRDLSISYNKLGDVAVAQGQLADAARAYTDGLAIRKTLAAGDPSNTQWQRDLSISYNKLGDVADRQSKTAESITYWKQALDVLAGIEARGWHLSPQDRRWLQQLRGKVGAVQRSPS